uniref:Peptidase A1 domain-containing protein n=1 Tax=Bursaphelenchus xylophilus TaxID=6326 RepID=A0A1I7SRI2_BURXY
MEKSTAAAHSLRSVLGLDWAGGFGWSLSSKSTGIGFFNYRKEDFIAKVKAIPSPDGHWVAKIDKFRIGDSQTFANFEATISTTLHGISLPSALFNTVVRTLGAKYNRENGTYSVDCGKSLNLVLEINGAKIEVPLEAYTLKTKEGCTLLLKSHAESKQIVLGQAYFMERGVCLDYDNDEIHFHHDYPVGYPIKEGLTRINGGFAYVTKRDM